MATTTERLMQEGLSTMREMIAEIEAAPEAEPQPLGEYVDSLSALADAGERGDGPAIARFEATLLVDPALRAYPEPDRIPELDADTAYVEGVAGVLYLFRDDTHALTDEGHVIHLSAFTPEANEADFAAIGEPVVYVEVGDWIEYGDDGVRGPIRTDDSHWVMVDWADDEEDDDEEDEEE